jgi:hypothetical protein
MFRGCSLPTRPATSLSGFSFDGPAVAYEAILPNFSSFKRPNEGGNVLSTAHSSSTNGQRKTARSATALRVVLAHTPFQKRAQ